MAKAKLNITKGNLDFMRAEFTRHCERGIKRFCKQHGLTFEPNIFINYNPGVEASLKLTFSQVSKNDRYLNDWNQKHKRERYGLKAEWLGRKIDAGRRKGILTLVGLDDSKRRPTLVFEDANGTKLFYKNSAGLSKVAEEFI